MPSGYLVQKIHNLRLAAGLLSDVVVEQGGIFSFWRAIGKPDKSANFMASRTIRDGRVEAEEGGGLCQVAGMLYEAALRCGFTITERFSHSMDIYAEDERFTPLGLDAAVVFGYKDLRFVNTSATEVAFSLRISGNAIQLEVLGCRPGQVRLRKLQPQRFADSGNTRRAVVHVLGAGSRVEKIIESQYRIPVKE